MILKLERYFGAWQATCSYLQRRVDDEDGTKKKTGIISKEEAENIKNFEDNKERGLKEIGMIRIKKLMSILKKDKIIKITL